MGTLSEVCNDKLDNFDILNVLFYIQAAGDRVTNEENKNEFAPRYTAEVCLIFSVVIDMN